MRKIIKGLIYDTEKAEEIVAFNRVVMGSFLGFGLEKITREVGRKCFLYRTSKGRWFELRAEIKTLKGVEEELIELDDNQVRVILASIADVENYEKYFNKLEEA